MITLNNVLIGYSDNIIGSVLNGEFRYGSMTAVIGNNGSGKSTLLKTIAGIVPPISGNLELKMIKGKRPYIGYLSQQEDIDRQFPLTVFDVVSMGCWPITGLLNKTNFFQKQIIWQSLDAVKLINMYHRNISTLSGGEFQRMLLARLLVQQAPLILLDEPFNNIDMLTYNLMMLAISKLHKQGCTIIISLHDCSLVMKDFSNVLFLSNNFNVWDNVVKNN